MFKFELDAVLSLREKIEDSKKRELGLEIQKQEQLMSEKHKLINSRQHLYGQMKQENQEILDVRMIKQCSHYLTALEKAIEKKESDIQLAGKKVEEKREELIDAMKNRKMLDNLKEIKKEQYQEEARRMEANQLDEVVTYKYGTKRKGE